MNQPQAPHARAPDPDPDPDASWRIWIPLIAVPLLSLLCAALPPIALFTWGPLAGLAGAVIAVGGFAWLGPRPLPGLLQGLLAMTVLASSLATILASALALIR